MASFDIINLIFGVINWILLTLIVLYTMIVHIALIRFKHQVLEKLHDMEETQKREFSGGLKMMKIVLDQKDKKA